LKGEGEPGKRGWECKLGEKQFEGFSSKLPYLRYEFCFSTVSLETIQFPLEIKSILVSSFSQSFHEFFHEIFNEF
jgi:hypothetical protein